MEDNFTMVSSLFQNLGISIPRYSNYNEFKSNLSALRRQVSRKDFGLNLYKEVRKVG